MESNNCNDVDIVHENNISELSTYNDTQTFHYNLNTNKTRKNLEEGAIRSHYMREDKKTCTNMTFSDGAFSEAVLNAVDDLKNGPKFFVVGKEDVERVSIESRKELSGKYVDTKLEFKVKGDV